jgi:hypothetical protein
MSRAAASVPLQRVDSRHRESGQRRITVIQPRCDESQDEADSDILADATSNLPQTSQMVKQVDAVLAMCDFIVSLGSNSTPRTNYLGSYPERAVMNSQFCQLCASAKPHDCDMYIIARRQECMPITEV